MAKYTSNVVNTTYNGDAGPNQWFDLEVTLSSGVFSYSLVPRSDWGATRTTIYGLKINIGGVVRNVGDIAWSSYTPGTAVASGNISLSDCVISSGVVSISASCNFRVGTWSSAYTAAVNSSIAVATPSVSTPTYTASNKYLDKIVAGVSSIAFSMAATPGTAGNTIVEYRLYQDGLKIYSGASSSCNITAPDSGTHIYYVVAVESNGATGQSASVTITTVPFTLPVFTSVTSVRWSNGDGTGAAADNGQHAKLTAVYDNAKVDGDDITTNCYIEVSTFSGTTTSGVSLYTGSILSPDQSYVVRYTLEDTFSGFYVVLSDIISIGGRGIDLIHSGTVYGVAVGKKAVAGFFDTAYPFRVVDIDSSGNITDQAVIKAQPVSSSSAVTKDSGNNIGAQTLSVWGRVVMLTLTINSGSSVGSYGNYFVGHISDYLPVSTVVAFTNWYEHPVVATIDTSGVIKVTDAGGYSSAFSSGSLTVSFIYLY